MKMKAPDTNDEVKWWKKAIERWEAILTSSYNRYRGKPVDGWIMTERKGIRSKIKDLQDKIDQHEKK